MARPVNELKRLHHKFDLANSTAPELYIALQRLVTYYVAFDAAFDIRDFVQQVRSRTPRINKWLMLAKKFVGKLAIACYSPGLDQGNSFPGFAKTIIIMSH